MSECEQEASVCGDDSYQIKIDKADVYGQCGGAAMLSRTIIEGDTLSWRATWVDPDGDPIDFTTGIRYGILRIFLSTGVITKRTTNAADWVWTNQANGEGYWTFSSEETEGWKTEEADAEAYFYDDATSIPTVHFMGMQPYQIAQTKTGELTP